ncbi:MAG TPA: pYEATS domain-containing protein [Thermoanaerobaculia bacterium]
MENRTGSSFLVSLAALVVALTAFLARSAPQQTTVATPATTTTAATGVTTTTTTTDAVNPLADATTDVSPVKSAADAVVAVMNAQTERYKAESARRKDDLEDARQRMTAVCDCIYKFVLLVVATWLVVVFQQRITGLTFFGVIFTLSPTPTPPPPPPGTKFQTTAASDTSRLYLTHALVRSLWRGQPRFLVRLNGDPDTLDTVREVKYYLHPDYREAPRIVNTTPFGLDIPAIGQFLLYADVKLSDDTIVRVQRYLNA